MTWFKVDDKFHASEEVMSINTTQRAAAIGLWTLAGAWSSDHLKNGYVPTTHLELWGGTVDLAEILVTAKLWTRVRKTGYQFRNWAKWQITREQVESAREAERDKKAAWRAAKAAKTGAGPEGVHQGHFPRPDIVPSIPTRPDPTRPDPTLKEGRAAKPSPYCARHPTGTDEPCGPCRTARMAFEARPKEKPPAPTIKRAKPGDGHNHKPDEHGYCPICGERAKDTK